MSGHDGDTMPWWGYFGCLAVICSPIWVTALLLLCLEKFTG